MTYHVQHLVINSNSPAPEAAEARVSWLSDEEVEHANVGTGVKKVWAAVFGSWGSLEPAKAVKGGKPTKTVKKRKSDVVAVPGDKVVKKIMMPSMPSRKALEPK